MKFLKPKLLIITAFVLSVGIFYGVIALYGLDPSAVLYAACLSVVFLAPFAAYKVFIGISRRKKLERLLKSGGAELSEKGALPEPSDRTELYYQELIRLIYLQKQSALR